MKILSTVLFSLLVSSASLAGPASLDRAVLAIRGTEASFVHKFTPKGFKTSQKESGAVIFGELPRMRWTYTTPESKLFVFDGAKSWFYIPADRQVTVADIDDRRRAELPFLLIGDADARGRQFIVKEQRRGNLVTTTLQPRSKSALIRTVAIVTSAQTNVIQSIDYTDRDGNRTSFAFSGYHPARTSADTFRFAAPAGVQVVNAE